ncbi:MAG: DUF4173 domain-containing protein [Firmicutes bacterium]|nr:DUF4173 domain-containing protein [Bacillota bacterium]
MPLILPFLLVIFNIIQAFRRKSNYHFEAICNIIGIGLTIIFEMLFTREVTYDKGFLRYLCIGDSDITVITYMSLFLPFALVAYLYLKYSNDKKKTAGEFAAGIVLMGIVLCAVTLLAYFVQTLGVDVFSGLFFLSFYALVPVNFIITGSILLYDLKKEKTTIQKEGDIMENIANNEVIMHASPEEKASGVVLEEVIQEREKMPHLKVTLITAAVAALLFTICFKGEYVRAGLSSLLFFNTVSIGSLIVLKITGNLKKKAGMLLTLPIFALSCFNAYFEYSHYNIFNCIAFYVLLSAMLLYCADIDSRLKLDSFLDTLFNRMFHAAYISGAAVLDKKSIDSENAAASVWKIVLGLIISVPVIAVIGTLLANGDDAFYSALESLADLDIGSAVWAVIVFVCVFVYACGYIYRILTNKRRIVFGGVETDKITSVAFLTPVNLLFLFFCYSQLSYVGKGVNITDFTTYARFAHEGFFQLLVVTFINFSIILVFTDILKCRAKGALQVSLCLLCVFTFVLIISSFYRMFLYMNAYGFTPLRIEVISFLAVESLLVFTTLYCLMRRKTDIVQSFVIGGAVTLLALNITARPEFSADLNNRFAKPDYDYMALEYYTHSSIPILIDNYNKTADAEKRDAIAFRIRQLYNDTYKALKTEGYGKHWQSLSIQEQTVQNLAWQFIEENKGK